MTDHSQHALYAPSGAPVWTVCTAQAEAVAHLPEQDENEAAQVGTAAHEEIERVLGPYESKPLDLAAMLDTLDSKHDAAYGIAMLLKYVNGLPPGRLWVEKRVTLTKDILGRCDVAHHDPASEVLTIVDYKNGFVGVDAEENEQLRIYAAASIYTHNISVKHVRYAVVQPNDFRPVPRVKQWHESADDLFKFATWVAGIPKGPKSFVAGDHCRDCILFGMCDATKDIVAHLGTMMAGLASEVPANKVALFLSCQKPIEHWFEALKKEHVKRALAGNVPPGMKVVTSQTHRAWVNEAKAREAIVAAGGVEALKLPSPADAEKMGIDVSDLAQAPPGGPVLAFESDKRKPYVPKSAAEMFAGVTGAGK